MPVPVFDGQAWCVSFTALNNALAFAEVGVYGSNTYLLVKEPLLALHIANIHWIPSHPTINELAALQFAAKAQESLILISLTDVLLHRIRYGLLSGDGVALGFLSSPFNISFSLRYLVSREFWSPSLDPTTKRPVSNIFTAAIVFLFALIGIAAGPSAAIAMIPRYDWWQVSLPPELPHYNHVVERDSFAVKLDSRHIPSDKYCSLVDNQPCVNQNLSTILQALKTLGPDTIGSEPFLLGNVTAPSPFGPPHRQITLSAASLYSDESEGVMAYAVTPMEFIITSLNQNWVQDLVMFQMPQYLIKSEAMVPSGKEKWKQPLMAVHCVYVRLMQPFNKTSATFSFKETLYDGFTVTLDFKDFNGTFDVNIARSVKPMILNMQNLLPAPVAASILFAHSYMTLSSLEELEDEFEPEVKADVWFYPKESQDLHNHLGFPLSNAMKYMRQHSGPEDAIKMTVEWLTDIRVPPGSANSTRENPAYLQIMKSCPDKESPALVYSTCLPGSLAAYFANALARITALIEGGDGFPISSTPNASSTVVYNTYFEHVYTYRFRASTTLRLTFSALFLQSKPPKELNNIRAGVQRSGTWKLVTIVREAGEGGQLEIFVRAPTAISHRGKVNTCVEERGEAGMKIPQAGTKYG
ncbi:hypothetical protein B0T10DRAFT_456446 [Thelonectria olida]|uniref:Uncharacterized protein n=1 Tax=Thelonectria olida TaxID=1576542 RepID=A0A9P9ATC2_9HYPO|nr:hypothetical protein B0T10DRAFT_456446 [Thelonectria olida]